VLAPLVAARYGPSNPSKAHWDEPIGGPHCVAYGTREYTARLWDIPFMADWIQACKSTPIQIHNKTLLTPDRCEDLGMGGMYGHWLVNFEETSCLPYWGSFKDLGCTAEKSHLHRFQSRLWGIKKGEDWMTLCATAPANIWGSYIPRPRYCDDRGWFWGMYGIWELYDPNC
jgi:hypothetical protein